MVLGMSKRVCMSCFLPSRILSLRRSSTLSQDRRNVSETVSVSYSKDIFSCKLMFLPMWFISFNTSGNVPERKFRSIDKIPSGVGTAKTKWVKHGRRRGQHFEARFEINTMPHYYLDFAARRQSLLVLFQSRDCSIIPSASKQNDWRRYGSNCHCA